LQKKSSSKAPFQSSAEPRAESEDYYYYYYYYFEGVEEALSSRKANDSSQGTVTAGQVSDQFIKIIG